MVVPRASLAQATRTLSLRSRTRCLQPSHARTLAAAAPFTARTFTRPALATMTGLHGILDKVTHPHHKEGESSRNASTNSSTPASPVDSKASSEVVLGFVLSPLHTA